jgi:hypothetical protein
MQQPPWKAKAKAPAAGNALFTMAKFVVNAGCHQLTPGTRIAMGAEPPRRRWLELNATHRTLVFAALFLNTALLVLAAVGGETRDALYVFVFGAPPSLLLTLRKHPCVFVSSPGYSGWSMWR